jgi:hypothetical protein
METPLLSNRNGFTVSSVPLQVNYETRYTVRILENTLSYDNSNLAETFSGYPDIIEELVMKTKSRVISRWVTYVYKTLISKRVTSPQTTGIHTAHTFCIITFWIRDTTDNFRRNLLLESKVVVCSLLSHRACCYTGYVIQIMHCVTL